MTIIRDFVERDSTIVEMCRNKSVLHLGCVGFTDCPIDEKVRQARESLHAQLTDVASSCTGVDLDGRAITELKDHGVFDNIVEGNVEHLEKLSADMADYDVVVAGDIIEHLSNPGLMLDGIRARLGVNGVLIVSTPNAFGIASWIRVILGRFKEGEQHVICFNPTTLEQLLERHCYRTTYLATCHQSRAIHNYGLWFRILRFILRTVPRHGGTLLCVCKPEPRSV
jgi:2-polyprenyl-3-methyl-5-hydroxy-6-metoxy-1,4-benzoquinol methylase